MLSTRKRQGPTTTLRFLPPGSLMWEGNHAGKVPPDVPSRDLEDALRGLHAMHVPMAVDAEIRSSGRRSISVTMRRNDLPRVRRFLFPAYRGWSWSERPSLPPATSWVKGRVAELRPLHRIGSGPFPRIGLRELPRWSPWEGFLRMPAERGWNAWMRATMAPWGPSYSTALPLPPSEQIPLPPHAIGRRIMDQQVEREVEMRWGVSGVMLVWPDETIPRYTKEGKGGFRVGNRLRGMLTATIGSPTWGSEGMRPAHLARLVEAYSTVAGGEGFTLSWLRTSWGRHRTVERHFSFASWGSRGSGGRTRAYLTPPEVVMWMPPVHLKDAWMLSPGRSVEGSGVCLGTDPVGTPVQLPMSPAEGHHLLVAGETGMGKSTLMIRMAAQALKDGTSMVVFDPLGDTARNLIESLPVPTSARALLIAPHVSPVGLNALAPPIVADPSRSDIERERAVSELVSAFRKVRAERYGDTFYWGPRIEEILTRVFSFLSYVPGATLHDAVGMLSDPHGVHLPFESEPARAGEMQRLLSDLQGVKPEDMEGARRVVSEVTLSPSLSRLLASTAPRWDLSMALAPGSVTCVSMERSSLGARASSYLGSITLSLLLSRLAARGEGQEKVILILDEVQEYANGSLIEMLRMGRRYNLHIWAATQSVSALPTELQEALLTNVRDLVLFRGSPADAKLASEHLGAEAGRDLLALPRGRARVFLEKASRVTTVTVPLPASQHPSDPHRMDAVIERSRPFWNAGEARGMPVPAEASTGTPKDPHEWTDVLLYALLAGSLTREEGEAFAVPLTAVEAMAGGDRNAVRVLGSVLKGRGALVRSDSVKGKRSWVLTRHGLEVAIPEPWSGALLTGIFAPSLTTVVSGLR